MNHQKKHFDQHRRFPQDFNWNVVLELFLWLVSTAVVTIIAIALIGALLSSCQKESSFTSKEKPVTVSKCNLMPREGFTPLAKRDPSVNELARKGGNGKGKGGGKPPKDTTVSDPPTDTTGNDEPNDPPPPPPVYKATLYLAFDGENLSNTWWFGLPTYLAPSGLTAAERDTVIYRTTLEYQGYGYQVTTDRGYYMLADPLRRQMTVFTEDWQWYGQAGGVAYLNSFGQDQPCFVFTSLLNYNEKYIADAGIHEIGHTVGLRHIPQPDGSSAYATYGNYMGTAYYVPRGIFETAVKDQSGAIVNQVEIITSKAK